MFLYIITLIFSFGLSSSIIKLDEQWQEYAAPVVSHSHKRMEKTKKFNKINMEDVIFVLKDPDDLITDTFTIPKGLYERVLFWARIYALHSSTSVIFHDTEDLGIVYSVKDYSDIWASNRISRSTKYWRMQRKVKLEKERLVGLFNKFKKGVRYSRLNREEKRVYNLIRKKGKKTKLSFALAEERLRHQTGQSNFIIRGVRVSGRYLPLMEEIFKSEGVPWEITRLPFVESSFNLKAASKVGAKGIWQFMDETGSRYLTQDTNFDERFSPIKATLAAANLMNSNFTILKSWPLAITAYNHGPYGLLRAKRKFKTDDIVKIVDKYNGRRFGFASKNFYSEFLAALYVTVYYERLFGNIDKEDPINFYYTEVKDNINVKDLSNVSGVNVSEISFYNPELSSIILRGMADIRKGYVLKLPPLASLKVRDYFAKEIDKIRIDIKESQNRFGRTNL